MALANCRMYIAPSVALVEDARIGPESVEELDLADSRILAVLAAAETTFLATITPDGMPDVSHRGGQLGFLKYDPTLGVILWTEYLGDSIF